MSNDEDHLLHGSYAVADSRTVDLETLVAASQVIGHLAVNVEARLSQRSNDTLLDILWAGTIHHANIEPRSDLGTANSKEKADELEWCLAGIGNELKSAIRERDNNHG